MAQHQITPFLYNSYGDNQRIIKDPGTDGVFNLRGIWGGRAVIASGNRVLPNGVPPGVKLLVYSTGNSTLKNVATTTVATLAAGEMAECVSLTGTTWGAVVYTAGALEINTAADLPIADAGAYTDQTQVEATIQELFSRVPNRATTFVSTAGNGTLTGAALVGGHITRTGPTADYTDTTGDSSSILTALKAGAEDNIVQGLLVFVKNAVAFTQTIDGGTGVTVTGVVPPNSTGVYLLSVDRDGGTATMTMIGVMAQCVESNGKYTTTAAASPLTAAAGNLTGARQVFFEITTDGAFGLTTRTAAEMFGDIPNCHVGYTYLLTVVNRGNNTVTITGGSNVTITAGENTLATLVTRTYLCRFTSATAATWSSLSKGTIET